MPGLFRDTAEGETGHAFGHMDFLAAVGDPATDEPVGDTEQNLASAVAGETYEFTAMYPGFAKTAREEGFDEIADWFATLARAEKTHAGRFQKALDARERRGGHGLTDRFACVQVDPPHGAGLVTAAGPERCADLAAIARPN